MSIFESEAPLPKPAPKVIQSFKKHQQKTNTEPGRQSCRQAVMSLSLDPLSNDMKYEKDLRTPPSLEKRLMK
jgi:hypothetical protein